MTTEQRAQFMGFLSMLRDAVAGHILRANRPLSRSVLVSAILEEVHGSLGVALVHLDKHPELLLGPDRTEAPYGHD